MAETSGGANALLIGAVLAAAVLAACTGGEAPAHYGVQGGAGGTSGSAGAGGIDAGGASGSGGSAGTGAGGTGGTGVVCKPGGYWPCTFDPACSAVKPAPADHDAYKTADCLSCHATPGDAGAPDAAPDAGADASAADAATDGAATDAATDGAATDAATEGGVAPEFLFGGFIWSPYAKEGVPGIEVGVRDGTLFYYACTDARGFFFVPASAGPEPDWSAAQSHIRSSIGEKIMPPDKQHGPGCNSSPDCHGDPQNPLYAPI